MLSLLLVIVCPYVNADCNGITVPLTPNKTLQLVQQKFADNQRDLALIERTDTTSTAVHRITFGGRKNSENNVCCLQPLLLQKGDNWGWHVLWQEHDKLFYLRVDGEAWVSSPPKKLAQLVKGDVKFSLKQETLTINWQQTEQGLVTQIQAVSTDEGRSWNIASVQP